MVSGISLYESGYGLTCRHLNSLSVELDESSLPYRFDISIFSKLTNDALIEEIEKTGVVLYRREGSAFVAEA